MMRSIPFLVFIFVFLLFFVPGAFAACQNFENSCYACQNGNQLCYGTDSQTGATCTVSQSCNTATDKVYSCDCNGQVGDTTYTQVSCGDQRITCTGNLAPNNSYPARTCHYCVSQVATTGVPPTPTPTLSQQYIIPTTSVQIQGSSPIPGLTLSLSAPTTISQSDNIQYNVSVSFSGSTVPLASITVYEAIPQNAEYVSCTGNCAYDGATKRISWALSDPLNEKGFSFTLKPTITNGTITNQVFAVSSYGSSSTVGQTANQSTCNGTYTLDNPLGNFGDPSCQFNKDDLYTLLQQQDPAHANQWFYVIAPCESQYNANAWRDPNEKPHTPDPVGAWGLYQMGRGRNGIYDHGDVIWQEQTTNAIAYNHKLGDTFGYWACAHGRP